MFPLRCGILRAAATSKARIRKTTIVPAVCICVTPRRRRCARGGTVVHSRSIADGQAVGFLGMSMQNEKDMVFIVTDNDHKLPIMQAIGEKCGMHSEAKGTVVSLPIDAVSGIVDSDD